MLTVHSTGPYRGLSGAALTLFSLGIIKGIVHPKMKILSVITHPYVPTL